MNNALAIILAAGEGARMQSNLPKPLHDVCGAPMIEYVLRALESVCPERIVVVGHGADKVKPACRDRARFAVQAPDAPGTGNAVKCCMKDIEAFDGAVIVTAADKPLVLSETYARLIGEIESGCDAAVLTAYVERPIGYDRVLRGEGGRVTALVPARELTHAQFGLREVSASVYAFRAPALARALAALESPESGECRFHEIVKILSDEGANVRAVPALEPSECMGVNDRAQLSVADAEMRKRLNLRHMRAGVTIIDPERVCIQPDVMIGRDTVIHPGCEIGSGSVIGEGCVLRANCQIVRSTVGAHAQLGNTLVKDAVIGEGATLEHAVVVGAAIPDRADVPPFTCVNGKA